jgi:hypothetical protein
MVDRRHPCSPQHRLRVVRRGLRRFPHCGYTCAWERQTLNTSSIEYIDAVHQDHMSSDLYAVEARRNPCSKGEATLFSLGIGFLHS